MGSLPWHAIPAGNHERPAPTEMRFATWHLYLLISNVKSSIVVAGQNSSVTGHETGHSADTVVGGVRDQEISCGVHEDAVRALQLRRDRRSAIAGEARRAIARDGRNRSVAMHPANAIVSRIGQVDVAGAIQRHAERAIDATRWSRGRRRR